MGDRPVNLKECVSRSEKCVKNGKISTRMAREWGEDTKNFAKIWNMWYNHVYVTVKWKILKRKRIRV